MKLQKYVLMTIVMLVAGIYTLPTESCACYVNDPDNDVECCFACCSTESECWAYLRGEPNGCEPNQYCDEDPFYCQISCWSHCVVRVALNDNEIKTDTLRRFRDEVLSTTPVGQEYIRLYYQWSPFIVQAMEEDAEFKEKVREFIEQLLPMIEAMVQ